VFFCGNFAVSAVVLSFDVPKGLSSQKSMEKIFAEVKINYTLVFFGGQCLEGTLF
jgi:hypothetical protein